jgi:hypothetical protein
MRLQKSGKLQDCDIFLLWWPGFVPMLNPEAAYFVYSYEFKTGNGYTKNPCSSSSTYLDAWTMIMHESIINGEQPCILAHEMGHAIGWLYDLYYLDPDLDANPELTCSSPPLLHPVGCLYCEDLDSILNNIMADTDDDLFTDLNVTPGQINEMFNYIP